MGQLVDRKSTKKKEISVELYVAEKVISTIFQNLTENAARDAEWKKAAEVLNYYALIFHLIVVMVTLGAVFWKHVLV